MRALVCRSAAWILIGSVGIGTAASAEDANLARSDRQAIETVIRAQLEAIGRDDGEAAFSYAAPAIQTLFGTPKNFLAMVKDVYRPLYRPRRILFLGLEIIGGELTQKMLAVDQEGESRMALYLMDRQDDGSWKILGCVLRPLSLDVI